ncbi:hypothetical protein TH63_15580 [Rufibacter radiotolerans]|uniref:Glycoside hydrolase family 5 domain-containing protein n=1 Tax=Rufibacter radiotolerans TaxID=1379910 RepID=A0A0H4VLP1_9BACT|nr:cellulase family glycosylhydrolase [Rufibacter radiotolerans]AKQ46720.1 hypothetical protein TH63_15580 [Rufibacter radiotolerans]
MTTPVRAVKQTIKKGPFWFILFLLVLGTVLNAHAQEAPFRKGVNLTGWFQANSAKEISFSRYTRQDFEQIKSLGVDVIRLPINLHGMTKGAPNYTLDPLFLTFLDEAIGWAEALDLHLILDNHSFDPLDNTQPDIELILEKVWPQMARRYRDRSDKIYYEILNEPHGIADATWGAIQGRIIQAIRKEDTRHTLIVGPSNFNSYANLAQLPAYPDNKLIYTFHFYDPFLFTHQGASWVAPSMVPLANMPFPYRAPDMPGLPANFRGSWMESAYNNYAQDGTVAKVKQLLDIAAQFKQTRKVPLFCGEFGVFMPNSRPTDRVFWYDTVRRYLEEKGIAWTSWDYHGEFGLFSPGGSDQFQHDLNVPLLQALGFTVPTQTPFVKQPETAGFALYSDYLGRGIMNASYGNGPIDFYFDQKPNNGRYSLLWTGADQYSSIVFDFKPDKDLSTLKQQGYALDFMFRGTAPATSVDIRFIDTKTTAANDHPWRSRVTLNAQSVPFDGRWHHVRLPLSSFTEQGSWDNNAWHNPEGKFDWANIDKMEITAEHGALGQAKLWFDNIYLSNQDTAQVHDPTVLGVENLRSSVSPVKVHPNPASGYLLLETSLPGNLAVEMSNGVGAVIYQNRFQQPLKISTASFPAGTYLLKVTQPNGQYAIHKVLVQR